jgi:hypothetical protein
MRTNNQLKLFEGSQYKKEFEHMLYLLKNSSNVILESQPLLIQIATSFFDDFKVQNKRICKSIQSNLNKGFNNIYNILENHKHSFHIVDLYIVLIVCGCAYKNTSLINLMAIIANDEKITKALIEEAIEKCLYGYHDINKTSQTKGGYTMKDLYNVISTLILISTTIWTGLNYYHYTVSNANLFSAIKNGHVANLADDTIAMFNNIRESAVCQENAKKFILKQSRTREAVTLFQSAEANQMLESIENAFICLKDPSSINKLAEDAAILEMDIEGHDTTIEFTNDVIDESIEKSILNKNSMLVTSSNHPLMIDVASTDIVLIGNNEIDHITNQAKTLVSTLKNTKVTYKKARKELLSLVEDEDINKLAEKLLTDEGFKNYLEEVKMKERTQKQFDNKIHVYDAPGLMNAASIILGATYDFFMTNPSHTPFYDVIWNIKQQLINFERDIENKIMQHKRRLTDVSNEIDRLSIQFKTAWERSAKISVGIFMIFSELAVFLLGSNLLNYKKKYNKKQIKDSNRTVFTRITNKASSGSSSDSSNRSSKSSKNKTKKNKKNK